MADKPKQIVRVEPTEIENAEQMLRQAAPGILKTIPHEKREQLRLIQFSSSVTQTFTGPLPPPEHLERFNEIIPNGADRIMQMAEAQSSHRIQIESHVVEKQQRREAFGQWFGFIIGMSGLVAGTILVLKNHDWAGASIGGATLVSLVTVFVQGKAKQKKNLETKQPGRK